MKMLQKGLPSLRTMAACGIAISGLAMVVWFIWPTTFRFHLDQISDCPDDVAAVCELASAVRRIQDYKVPPGGPDVVHDLTVWIQQVGTGATRWEDLARAGSPELAGINAWVAAIHQFLPNESFEEYRDLPRNELTPALNELAKRLVEERDAVMLSARLNEPRSQVLLRRLKAAPFPARDHSFIGNSQQRWLKTFQTLVDTEVRPIAALFESMLSEIETPVTSSLRLVRLESFHGKSSLRFSGFESTCDFALFWNSEQRNPVTSAEPTTSSPEDHAVSTIDTGVRLVRVGWQNSNDKWQPIWPPHRSATSVDLRALQQFAVHVGIPASLRVLSANPRWSDQRATIELTVGSPQFANWKETTTVALDAASLPEFRHAQAAINPKLLASLASHVASLREYGGRVATIEQETAESTELEALPRLAMSLQDPSLGVVKLDGWVDESGLVNWSSLPASVAERRRLLKAAALDGAGQASTLKSLSVDAVSGAIVVEVTKNDDQGVPRVVKQVLDIPRSPSEQVASTSNGVQPTADVQLTAAHNELARQIADEIKKQFPRAALHTDIIVETVESQPSVALELRIGDWPPLELGPVAGSGTPVEVVRALLSEDSLKTASNAQWGTGDGVAHPRYGQIRSGVEQWNANAGTVRIRSSISFHGLGEVPWFENVPLDCGRWTKMSEAQLADMMEPFAREKLREARRMLGGMLADWFDFSSVALDEALRVDLDAKGIDGNSWLGLNPPRIAVSAESKMPFIGLPIYFDGIIIGLHGITLPDEYGSSIPMTFATPFVALQNSGLSASLHNPALRVRGRFTPPYTPGVVVTHINPFEGVFGVDSSVKGYWRDPKIEGDADVRVAGRPGLAKGDVSVNYDRLKLQSRLRGGGSLPGMETLPLRLAGELNAEAGEAGESGRLSMETGAQVLGKDIGNLSASMGDEVQFAPGQYDSQGLDLHGNVSLAGISLAAQGGVNSSFDRYTVQGFGGLGPISYLLTADEKDARLERATTVDGSQVHDELWAPDLECLATISESEGAKEWDIAPTVISDDEKQVVIQYFQRVPVPKLLPKPDRTVASPVREEVTFEQVPAEDMEWKRLANKQLAIVQRSTQQTIAKFDSDLPDYAKSDDARGVVWWSSLLGGRVLFQRKNQPVAHLFSSDTDGVLTGSAEDLSEIAGFVGADRLPIETRLNTVTTWVERRILDDQNVPGEPEAIEGATAARFLCLFPNPGNDRASRISHVVFAGSDLQVLLPTNDDFDATKMLAAQNSIPKELPSDVLPRLVGYRDSPIRFGWYEHRRADQGQGRLLVVDADGHVLSTIATQAAANIVDGAIWESAANLFAAIVDAESLVDAKALFTPRAEVFAMDESRLFVGLTAADAPLTCWLSKEQLYSWPDESDRFLPKDWGSSVERRSVQLTDLARMALVGQMPEIDRERFPVDPVGLIFNLASKMKLEGQ